MARFIVHIGDGKCGSTAIQKSLYAAREQLSSNNIFYDTSTPDNGHFSLITLVGGETRGNNASQKRFADRSVELVRKRAQKDDYILISAESFFFVPIEKVFRFLEGLEGCVDELHVIAYVRRPDSMYLSLVQQTLKGNHLFARPSAYQRNIDSVLRAWKDASCVTSLTVRAFCPRQLLGNDVVSDFEHVLSNVVDGELSGLPRLEANRSLSAEQMVVLQRFRADACADDPGKLRPESNLVVRLFEQLNERQLVGERASLSCGALRALRKRNTPIVERMADDFPSLDLGFQHDVDVHALNVAEKSETALPDWGYVGSILRAVDMKTVSLLVSILPFYNSRLRIEGSGERERALEELSLKFPFSRSDIERAGYAYWQAENELISSPRMSVERVV